MKRVVMPVRWQCAKYQRWYCGNQPCPWCWRPAAPVCHSSFFAVTGIVPVSACFPAYRHRFSNIQGDQIVQITETVLSEPVEIRRFIQQAVDHWPRLLAVHFTLHSAEGNINGQQIHAFCTSFYRQVHERITERNHTASPAPPVVLRWLREQHGGATMRCLLLLSQTSICHPRVSATVDEECSQRVDLLQQTWRVISADGQCRVERCFQAARGDTSGQYIALKTVALSSLFRILCKCLFSEVTVQAVTELDNKAAHCHSPVLQRHRPFLGRRLDCQPHHFFHRVVCREHFTLFDRMADHAV